MGKTILGMVLGIILFLITGVYSIPAYACPIFEGTVNISGNTNIAIGESTTLSADWETNMGVTRSCWWIDGVPQGVQTTGGCAGSSSITFSSDTEGNYTIAFGIWHHIFLDRWAMGATTVTVSEEPVPPPPPPPKPISEGYMTFDIPWGGGVVAYSKLDGTFSEVFIVGYFGNDQYAIKITRGTIVKDNEGKTPASVWFGSLSDGTLKTVPGVTFSQQIILYKVTDGRLWRTQAGEWVGGTLVEITLQDNELRIKQE